MSSTISGFADIGDAKLYYEIAGEGETLVLSHAAFLDSRMWDDQFGVFAKQFRVFRYDMRGYGRSDPATAPVSRRDDLRRLLDLLGIERAHLLGCSMSGEMMLDFTLEHPDRALSLTTSGSTPSGFALQGEPPPYVMEMIGALQQGQIDYGSELQLRIWVDGMYRTPDQVDPEVRRRAAEMNIIPVRQGTFFTADGQPLNPLDPPAVGRLGEVRVPTLIMDGALENPEIRRAGDLMVEQMPDARRIIIEGGAHVPNMDNPDDFNRAVLEFLQSVRVR